MLLSLLGSASFALLAPTEPACLGGSLPLAGIHAHRGAQGVAGQKAELAALRKLFENTEAVERGEELLKQALESAGGLASVPMRSPDGTWVETSTPTWSLLPGLRWQSLEMVRTGARTKGTRMDILALVPRTVHLDPKSQGYLYSEMVDVSANNADRPEALYYREVVSDSAIWVETDKGRTGSISPSFERDASKTQLARMRLGREVVVGLMPHGLPAWGGHAAYVETQEYNGERIDVVALRWSREIGLLDHEPFKYAQIYVRNSDRAVLQIHPPGFDGRQTYAIFSGTIDLPLDDSVLAFAKNVWIHEQVLEGVSAGTVGLDATGLPAPSEEWVAELREASERIVLPEFLRIPANYSVVEDQLFEQSLHRKADPRIEALPAAALAKPWLAGAYWLEVPRADAWDPPPADGEASSSGEGEAAAEND